MRTMKLVVLCLWLAFSLTVPQAVKAQTSTLELIGSTITAYPSCLRWRPEGVCAWLRCYILYCEVRVSIRVSHFVPDAFVSTYHDPNTHPWADFGRPIARAANSVAPWLLSSPSADSAGTRKTKKTWQGRDADAIGNPVHRAIMSGAGSISGTPSSVVFPTPEQMTMFPMTFPAILAEWGEAIASLGGGALSFMPSEVGTLMDTYSSVVSAAGILDSVMGGGMTEIPAGDSNGELNAASILAAATGSESIPMCPGASSYFNLHYQSHLDAWTWRGVYPVELMYPGSWIPGWKEVGNSLANTWGPTFPRTFENHQVHGVKASAVVASRVADVIGKHAQPHIYAPLAVEGGVRYFAIADEIRWQRLYPYPSSTCAGFGGNDSLSLTSYGDGNTTEAQGHVWNLWRRYDCCQVLGIFLVSIP